MEKIVEQVGIFLYEYFKDGDGKKQGILKKYDLNKTLCEELEYKDDYLNGKVLKYEDGRLVLQSSYILNRLDGELKEYYRDGNIKSISQYSLGKLHGKRENYFENGKISMVTHCIEDKLDGKKEKYYENGQLEMEGYYCKNNMVGVWKWYDKDGKILKVKEFE